MSDPLPENVVDQIRWLYRVGFRSDAAWEKLLAPNCAIVESSNLSFGGDFVGREGNQRLAALIFQPFSDVKFDVHGIAANGDLVVADVSFVFTRRSDGGTFVVEALEKFTFKDGRIVEVRPFYWEAGPMNAALAAG